ncbi:MAG: LytTR family DNA-binding domain-containing protein [Defluviitaleaceae bacterium]|nr:LytTR family DNA-binding domain-containing protein [Defluviitaleaceae bacterium]
MIKVAICDDETNIGAALENDLLDIFGKLNVKFEIGVFFTGEALYKKMDGGAHYDLIFLDIEFARSDINGIEVGRRIREVHQNHLTAIVYISWEKKYALQLFDIQPFNFLVKPLNHDKIENVVRKYLQISGQWSGTFTYKVGHDTQKVQIKDIVYIESHGRKLSLHFANGKHEEIYGSIKTAYEEQLKKFDFLFIHNAYVVNYDYVTALKIDQVLLTNHTTPLPISKHRRNEVRDNYFNIMKQRSG